MIIYVILGSLAREDTLLVIVADEAATVADVNARSSPQRRWRCLRRTTTLRRPTLNLISMILPIQPSLPDLQSVVLSMAPTMLPQKLQSTVFVERVSIVSSSQLLLATTRRLRSLTTSPARAKTEMTQRGSASEAVSSEAKSRRRISRPSAKEAWTMATVVDSEAEAVDEAAIVGDEETMRLGEGEVP